MADAKALEAKRKTLEKETMALQELRREQATLVATRQTLDSQLQENELVEAEFGRLQDGARIYKMVGPALVPQDRAESVANVQKRLEFIRSEIQRVEGRLEKLVAEQQRLSTSAYKLQMEIQGAAA
ncbi:Prefoldin subunit 6 [Coemansia javaensis]|uniref:Prefoldin subunit 6 n=1 Tax=Coemansia javaensis TaxID=2761396 RepID=A0A9W8H2A8_9FUNG|nr:Prefoldin subunit 6 [Coemansia javaensis]